MTHRGRGCLEVNPSENPFFQTTSSQIGANIVNPPVVQEKDEQDDFMLANASQSMTETEKVQKPEEEFDFSFLYTRASDVIGSKQNLKPNKMASSMETHVVRPKRISPKEFVSTQNASQVKADIETVISSYKHEPKEEDPRYTTTANEHGFKRPTQATYVAERLSRPQGFSNGFNGVKPKNSSLNTTLSKSNVHKQLDPQFM
mmetsp:Transcript_25502/g.43002  ORF Transcript_25502/g.43002 Transcript_25502/m.43002 type:complete len:202 (+) Transcript_25502:89-694(+)|eukprot:CAMPEP_0114429010 /NCGR_PEP_ID=MMETSP0103-20121206/9245_1 /TAXON_ID=37642 ORGANISM="Paraphysomonas imperforata, Strain PA2" /NCGR_SAMPLE_ID=MMETSP0103 /ASSEMBLY_ACC=CAM_ASM_000201 /LENGTH=201 /DNA_ID=CAMNT_0001598293 /DNA_START=50 /DNA_END=655 /DNA_ORIENTATION=+